jgi:outer membrane lipoprotein-sorting protein
MIKYLILLIALAIPVNGHALSPQEIVKNSQKAFLYQGDDFKARVVMKLITKSGKERIREMTMLRKNYGPAGGEQKYFIYFHKPTDVKKMTFMVYKYLGKDDDRWLFVPAINMTKRIAARDKTSSFVGSDFTYEDISGRDIEDDTHVLEKEDQLKGSEVYVIKSTPKAGDVNYSYKLSWIDKKNFLPLKEEYYDLKGELMKVFTAERIENVKEFPTVVQRTMKNIQNGHRTEVVFQKTDYNIGIEDNLFSERFLKRPPKRWIE